VTPPPFDRGIALLPGRHAATMQAIIRAVLVGADDESATMSRRQRTDPVFLPRGDAVRPGRRRVPRDAEAMAYADAPALPHAHPWAGSRDHPTTQTHRQAAILRAQRTHGNAHVACLIQRGRIGAVQTIARTPTAAAPAAIADAARTAETEPGVTLAFAGTPLKKDPPGGMNFIANQSGPIGLGGKPAGYTAVKSAAAFTAPSFVTRTTAEKDGYKRRYFAVVEPTTATDVTHPSFYPAPGIHDNAVSVQKEGTYRYYWKISDKMSELIRNGEQEHLNDAQRAYDLTYALIADAINAMVGQRFGPAESPDAADKLAEADLRRRLPAALGIDPLNWFNVLDAMLEMTTRRDRQHLHDVVPGKAPERNKTFTFPLETTEQTSIDQVPSDQIVNYPSAGKRGQPSGSTDSAASGTGKEEKDKST
jgi:hypothetical protein